MEHEVSRSRSSSRLDLTGYRLVPIVLAGLLGSCVGPAGGSAATPGSPEPDALHVVTTTTVLADLVIQIGGPKVSVTSLVPKGGEVHTFDPSPSDVVKVKEADLVVLNGLGLDEWLGQVVVDAGSSAPIVELAEDLEGVEYLEGSEHEGEDGEGAGDNEGPHAGEVLNPHLWLNVDYARRYTERIAASLAAADPHDAAAYRAGAAGYDARLAGLDEEIRSLLATIPEANRRLVSFHEAFPYFAAAYGLEIVGVIIDSPGQDPSAGEIAELVNAIRASGARAVFTEAQFSPDLARTVADEAGVEVVSDLYNDSLGDPPIDTYEAMMRWNAERTVEALR
jgi:zinc/manganese transport system substrate-binding protein/manganese/iron transport system substrate-binding protein